MGTNNENLENYLNLWKDFDALLKKKDMNLSSFAKKWERHHDGNEENDYTKIHDNLKKMRKRKDSLKNVHIETMNKLEMYITFISKEYVKINLLPDEDSECWFED